MSLFDILKRYLRRHLGDVEYGRAIGKWERLSEEEDNSVEFAEWFGTTGLSEDLERELPRYLRREFGEGLFEENGLKANDLKYLGAFDEGDLKVHYWSIPTTSGEKWFAHIEIGADGTACLGWGSDRRPPNNQGYDKSHLGKS